MRILLIEDDAVLGDGLRAGLVQEGYSVDWLTHGDHAVAALDDDRFDAVVLDLALPGRSGYEVLRAWRDAGHTVPVLILTASDGLDECVRGLDSGADDYVTKPVDLEELDARLRALTRRADGRRGNNLEYAGICFDLARHNVTLNGHPLPLSRRELALLEALLERPGQPVAREHLAARLYGWEDGPESNSIEVHVHHLRRHLGFERIATVRGLGYRLTDPEQEREPENIR